MPDEVRSLSTSECSNVVEDEKSSNKRPKFGRMRDLAKKLRASTYETGPDCKCKRYKCFKNINADERIELIRNFNEMGLEGGADKQSCYLSGLISVVPISRRRPRLDKEVARKNESSYTYKIKVIRNGDPVEVPVCYLAFQSIFGIKSSRLNTIKLSLRRTGKPPIDGRGKHSNRPHKLSRATVDAVMNFFSSLEEHETSLKHMNKVYLPQDLNVKKLHDMFCNEFPDIQISYETFREIFASKFNIVFGYPNIDTNSCNGQEEE